MSLDPNYAQNNKLLVIYTFTGSQRSVIMRLQLCRFFFRFYRCEKSLGSFFLDKQFGSTRTTSA